MKQYTHRYTTSNELDEWLNSFKLLQKQSVLIQIFSEVTEQKYLEEVLKIISKEIPQAVIINTSSCNELLDENNSEECVLISLSVFDQSNLKSSLVKGNDSETIAALVSLIEVTKQENKHYAQELSETNKFLELKNNALNASANGVVITNIDGKIQWANSAYSKLTGYEAIESFGLNPRDLVKSDKHDKEFFKSLWDTILANDVWHGEVVNKRKDGSLYHEEMTITPMTNKDGEIEHFVAVKQDISARKKMEELVHTYAFYDTLTKLPNRRLLEDRFTQLQALSKRSGKYSAMLFIDMDNFKPVNDEYGHKVGDIFLIDVANRIKQCVRDTDTVSRFGGDEFVVLLSELSANKNESVVQATAIAEKIRSNLEETYFLNVECKDDEGSVVEHNSSCSIGLTLFIEYQESQDDILRWADAAMYKAKESGKNQIKCY